MSAVPKGPSRQEVRAMNRILKETSHQTEQPSFFFFFFCIVFPLDFKELYVGEDPVEGIWKPQVLVLIQTRTETQVWRLSTGACLRGWSDVV